MESNELGWARLEADVLLSTRTIRLLTEGERDRLLHLLGHECELRGLDDGEPVVPAWPRFQAH